MTDLEVDQSILQVLTDLDDSMNLLASFSEEKRMPFYQKLENIVQTFQKLQIMSKKPEFDGTIPLSLIEYIDEGGNPDEYAQKLVTSIDDIQKVVAVQQEWMKQLKDSIDVLIDLNFPKEVEENQE